MTWAVFLQRTLNTERSSFTKTASQPERLITVNKDEKRRQMAWSTCGLWMSLQLFQHKILSSHASVIPSGPVTWSWYLSLIGHSLFTGIVKDADLCNVTLTYARKLSQWNDSALLLVDNQINRHINSKWHSSVPLLFFITDTHIDKAAIVVTITVGHIILAQSVFSFLHSSCKLIKRMLMAK